MKTRLPSISRLPAIRVSFGAALSALLVAVVLGLAAPGSATPAAAQQAPTSVNPTASSVTEQSLFKTEAIIHGRGSIPDVKSYNLIQPAGREWRVFHEEWLPTIGAVSILGMLFVLSVFYAIRGKIRIDAGPSDRTITRFNAFERFVHWLTASTFVVLAISGLNVTFGKHLILPLIGPHGFHVLAEMAKLLHNYLAFPFTAGVVLMLLVWLKDNIPNAVDVTWALEGGGLIGKGHPPAGKFNGGQKAIFWTVILGGGGIAVSGFFLLFPFYLTDIAGMQLAQMIHGVLTLLVMAVIMAHIYIGSVGMEGAYDAMGSGEVDLNWAKEHHSLWVEEATAKDPGVIHGHGAPAE